MLQLSREVLIQREIWFEKVGWSYMPCHWKGVAVMLAVIFLSVLAIISGQWALDKFGYGNADWAPFIVVLHLGDDAPRTRRAAP